MNAKLKIVICTCNACDDCEKLARELPDECIHPITDSFGDETLPVPPRLEILALIAA